MSDVVEQAQQFEAELEQLLKAEELDDNALSDLLERRQALHQHMAANVEADDSVLESYRPVFRRAYENTQAMLKRCETERADVQKKLITLNTSKKARKAY